MITALFSVSNGTIATAHTTDIDKDTTSLPGGQRNAQININEVCTILFHLHRAKLILTDDDDDDGNDDKNSNNEGYLSRYYNSFLFSLTIFCY